MEEMDENLENNNLEAMFKKLVDKSLKNFEEERELSLERYRRQDETITSPEDFVLQGKFAVDYLKVAADRSNAMIGVAKMLKDIVYKDSTGSEVGSSVFSDAAKKEIGKYLNTGKNKNIDKE